MPTQFRRRCVSKYTQSAEAVIFFQYAYPGIPHRRSLTEAVLAATQLMSIPVVVVTEEVGRHKNGGIWR